MDYVQEELARQRAVLAVLMMGRPAEAEASAEATGTERAFSPSLWGRHAARALSGETGSGAESWLRQGGPDTGETGGGGWLPLYGEAGDGPAVGVFLDGGSPSTGLSVGRWPEETQAMAGRTGAAGTGDLAAETADRESTLPGGGAVRERTVTELLWAGAGGTAGPKELSRTFQRDARRYDGGFSLY